METSIFDISMCEDSGEQFQNNEIDPYETFSLDKSYYIQNYLGI